jgi:glycosyltransferase involved in cell wall biosynthesis
VAEVLGGVLAEAPDRPIRALYVNHTAVISGAEQSLLVLLRSLPPSVIPAVACPEGELAEAVRRAGIALHPIPGTSLSARLHPVHTTRGLVRVAQAAWTIRGIARRIDADVVHANTVRAGLMTLAARGRSGARQLVHVRDAVPPGRLPRLMFRLLAGASSALISTSRFLADQLPPSWPSIVIANAVEPDRFDPAAIDRPRARSRLGLPDDAPVLVVVGQISPHKGQSDAIEALALVRRSHPDTRLLIVGSVKFASSATRFDNRSYGDELTELVARLQLVDAVTFLGERDDVAEILAAVDVLLVPSWYEPFGRVALEAMVMGVPVIATSVGGTREFVIERVDGLVRDPRRPDLWAAAITELLDDPELRARMGEAGRRRALADFSPDAHAEEVVAAYRRVLRTNVHGAGR